MVGGSRVSCTLPSVGGWHAAAATAVGSPAQWLGSKGARINNSESTLVKFREGMLPGEKVITIDQILILTKKSVKTYWLWTVMNCHELS